MEAWELYITRNGREPENAFNLVNFSRKNETIDELTLENAKKIFTENSTANQSSTTPKKSKFTKNLRKSERKPRAPVRKPKNNPKKPKSKIHQKAKPPNQNTNKNSSSQVHQSILPTPVYSDDEDADNNNNNSDDDEKLIYENYYPTPNGNDDNGRTQNKNKNNNSSNINHNNTNHDKINNNNKMNKSRVTDDEYNSDDDILLDNPPTAGGPNMNGLPPPPNEPIPNDILAQYSGNESPVSPISPISSISPQSQHSQSQQISKSSKNKNRNMNRRRSSNSKKNEEYKVGDFVLLSKNREGIIKFIGNVKFKKGIWYGIELTQGCVGTHDGKVQNTQPNRAIFVQKQTIYRKMTARDHNAPKRLDRRISLEKKNKALNGQKMILPVAGPGPADLSLSFLATAGTLKADNLDSKAGKILATTVVDDAFRGDAYSPYAPKQETSKQYNMADDIMTDDQRRIQNIVEKNNENEDKRMNQKIHRSHSSRNYGIDNNEFNNDNNEEDDNADNRERASSNDTDRISRAKSYDIRSDDSKLSELNNNKNDKIIANPTSKNKFKSTPSKRMSARITSSTMNNHNKSNSRKIGGGSRNKYNNYNTKYNSMSSGKHIPASFRYYQQKKGTAGVGVRNINKMSVEDDDEYDSDDDDSYRIHRSATTVQDMPYNNNSTMNTYGRKKTAKDDITVNVMSPRKSDRNRNNYNYSHSSKKDEKNKKKSHEKSSSIYGFTNFATSLFSKIGTYDSSEDEEEDEKYQSKSAKKKKNTGGGWFGFGSSKPKKEKKPKKKSSADIVPKRYFGCPLLMQESEQLDEYDSPIPKLLIILKEKLFANNGHQAEGIFRLAPSGIDNNYIKKEIESGKLDIIEFDKIDVMIIANLIKLWFRELPDPLLQCLKTEIIEKGTSSNKSSKIISTMPEPNQSVFLWLLDMCAQICQYKSITKMNTENLAIVVAPNLYDPSNIQNPMIAMGFMSTHLVTFCKSSIEWRQEKLE